MFTRYEKFKFTIIELLVVIVMIAILISILLPSLAGARRKARMVQCMSQMKQVNIAQMLYVSNSNNYYSPATGDSPLNENHLSWDDRTSSYMGVSMDYNTQKSTLTYSNNGALLSRLAGLYLCPSDNSISANYADNERRTYFINVFIGSNDVSSSILDVNQPSNTLIFGETFNSKNCIGRGNHAAMKSLTKWQLVESTVAHSADKFNYIMGDSSLQTMNPYDAGGVSGNWGIWEIDQ